MLSAFVDSDHAGDTLDINYTFGYILNLEDAACARDYENHASAALSIFEAEYHALYVSYQENIWMRRLMNEAGFEENISPKSTSTTNLKFHRLME